MTKVAFTLCSLNYMAQAKTLADSFKQHNPDWHFVIGLVDRVEGRLPDSYWQPHELIEVEELNIEGFKEMCEMYDIVELNTAVKPFYMKYLFERDERVEVVAYFDPDIMFFDKLDDLDEKISQNEIALTPHFYEPIEKDEHEPIELLCLSVGIFNLGFIALPRSMKSFAFLNWWQQRLKKYCFRNARGLFVDQIWINYAPVFFERLGFLHKGNNVAQWNLQERVISLKNGKFYVNDSLPLVFFHFSSYKPNYPQRPFSGWIWSDLFSFENRPDIKPIYDMYHQKLVENKFHQVSLSEYVFQYKKSKDSYWIKYPKHILRAIRKIVPKQARKVIKQILEV